MSDWTSGYVADIEYTYGYYSELNPLRVKLAFINAGLVAPQIGTACELGFGQGLSTNLHATASIVKWSGTDFNPSQAGFAQELARISETGAQLYDEAFESYCERHDLPDFDYIGLHGIWSWISDENRSKIVEFIRRKLKVGGVLYISYNTQPGWASMVPMRDLLTEHAEVMGSEGVGIVNRIDEAMKFVDQLFEVNPSYARANTHVVERMKQIKKQNRHYLAHEYFNRDWMPMAFSKMADWLKPAKVEWACSANFIEAVDDANLTKEQQKFLNLIPDRMFRETVRDYCVNQSFRKDYWVKGPRKLNVLERSEAMNELRFILIKPRADISLKMKTSLGEASLQEEVYVPILDAMDDFTPRNLKQLEKDINSKNVGISAQQLVQAILILSGLDLIAQVQDPEISKNQKSKTQKINLYLMKKARFNNEINYLCSPVTGGGIPVPRFNQLFLLAHINGKNEVQEQVQYVWNILLSQGQRLNKDGKALENEVDNINELKKMANAFKQKQLPILKALMIA